MAALKVIGILLGIIIIIAGLEAYINEKYNRSILDFDSIIILLGVELGFILVCYIELEVGIGKDNFFVIVAILAIIFLWILISNLKHMGVAGLLVTIIQTVAALLLIIILFLIDESFKKNRKG